MKAVTSIALPPGPDLANLSPSRLSLGALWLRSRLFRDRAARWNYQYSTGRWAKLSGDAEAARLDATARQLRRQGGCGAVLEIGCGEALLQRRIERAAYDRWVGIDISAVAIARAQAFATDGVRYEVGDMETFHPDGLFDVIVFTESIYYSADSARLLRRYARFLRPGGRFVISMFRTKRSGAIKARIATAAVVLDSTITTNELGSWDCEVLCPLVAAR